METATIEKMLARTAPLVATPATFLRGDWQLGNLGSHPDGRTVLLDWASPGAGPACWDLCWYLALNRARLHCFRAALEAEGIATGGWWEARVEGAVRRQGLEATIAG